MNKNVEKQITMLNEKMKEINIELENSGIVLQYKLTYVINFWKFLKSCIFFKLLLKFPHSQLTNVGYK